MEKELLSSRLKYLEQINQKPGIVGYRVEISQILKSMIDNGELTTFMQVEAVFNHLMEKSSEPIDELEQEAKDIRNFII